MEINHDKDIVQAKNLKYFDKIKSINDIELTTCTPTEREGSVGPALQTGCAAALPLLRGPSIHNPGFMPRFKYMSSFNDGTKFQLSVISWGGGGKKSPPIHTQNLKGK